MAFNTFEFICFFMGVYLLYTLLNHRFQNLLLLAASYVFYGAWDARFLNLILFSTLVDFHAGKVIGSSTDPKQRRLWLWVSVGVNLGLLGVFKYFGFFTENLYSLLQSFGFEPGWHTLKILLPMGISFYTFQTMSYTIDIYRGKLQPTRSFLNFALYVAYFPQLVAGPIERASRLLPQLEQPRTVPWQRMREGAWLILLGYFMKTVVADNLAPFVNTVFDAPQDARGFEVLLALVAFAFQIYGDFGGYSAIARGISLWMGVELMTNFRMPYFACTPSEFWQRWHISLSSWLRDYLYIPLGGNRSGPWNTMRNLLLTMLLGGLWHGAAWHFVAWGLFHGVLLVVFHGLGRTHSPIAWSPGRIFKCGGFFLLTLMGWLLFRVNHLSDLPQLLEGAFLHWTWNGKVCALSLLVFVGPLFLVDWLKEKSGDEMIVLRLRPWIRWTLYGMLFLMILLAGSRNNYAFIYFQF